MLRKQKYGAVLERTSARIMFLYFLRCASGAYSASGWKGGRMVANGEMTRGRPAG